MTFRRLAWLFPAVYGGHAAGKGRLTKRDVAVCTAIAGLVHPGVVARQIFFVGVPEKR
jgi:hypothetical protein